MTTRNEDIAVAVVEPAQERGDFTARKPIEIGQWYMCKLDWRGSNDDETKLTERAWLGCVFEIGTNYVELRGYDGCNRRIHLDIFDEFCIEEPTASAIIQAQVAGHRDAVVALLDEVRRLSASLGVAPRESLASTSEPQTQALAVAHGVADLKAHEHALIKAKTELLPGLFDQIKKENEKLSKWMHMELEPMRAQLTSLQTAVQQLDARIFTVQLYAGLVEEIKQISEGAPAPNDTKVSIFQRRHYMDEECLAQYEAGGMDYRSISDFDEWLARPLNRNRILPTPRCVVAFRVRRTVKSRVGYSLGDFIRINAEEQADKKTFLYMRNGDNVYRMQTKIEFGNQLFPDKERSLLQDGALWLRIHGGLRDVLTQREYDDLKEQRKKARAEHARELKEWKRKGKKGMSPYFSDPLPSYQTITRCTPDTVYYDDATAKIHKEAMDHNRIAVVLQGLLDRSPVFHPHPPWRIWTPEGFQAAVDLVFDDSKAITSGNAPNFEEYRKRLNRSIKRGSVTIGQELIWMRKEGIKEQARRSRDWRRNSRDRDIYFYSPYGNPGPGMLAEVASFGRDGKCTFRWTRNRLGHKWVDNPDRPGWMKRDESDIKCHLTCSTKLLFNVSAYTPGDYKMFFDDPRLRKDYLTWAPLLLIAEDYHAGKREIGKEGPGLWGCDRADMADIYDEVDDGRDPSAVEDNDDD